MTLEHIDINTYEITDDIGAVVLFSVAQLDRDRSTQIIRSNVPVWLTQNLNEEIVQLGKLGRPVKVRVLVVYPGQDASGLEALLREQNPNTEIICDYAPVESWNDYAQIYRCMRNWLNTYPWQPGLEEYFGDISTGTALMRSSMMQMIVNGAIPGYALHMMRGIAHALNLLAIHLSANQAISQSQSFDWLSERVRPAWGIPFMPEPDIIEQISQIIKVVNDPILLLGDTGTGKTRLVLEMAKILSKKMTEVNCATIYGDSAKSEIFGHRKGAFTGAVSDSDGLLKDANNGILFLDEIGELGLQEQAMLLKAIEQKSFMKMGGGKTESSFILIAGTNKNLDHAVKEGTFRRDLLARISTWTFRLPSLKECKDGIQDIINDSLVMFEADNVDKKKVIFDKSKAENTFISFASSDGAVWPGNIRELRASIRRMATYALASGETVISIEIVENEIKRLKSYWNSCQDLDMFMASDATPVDNSMTERNESYSVLYPKLYALVSSRDIFNEWEPEDYAHAEVLINACLEAESQIDVIRNIFPTWYKNNCGPEKNPNLSQKINSKLEKSGLSWKKIRDYKQNYRSDLSAGNKL